MHLMSRPALTLASLRDRIRRWTRPSTRPLPGYMCDQFRSRANLARENALLRKQLEVACRQMARPRFTRADRGMLVLLARLSPTWRSATLLVQPETILRWHRQAFQRFWRRKSKRTGAPPRIGADTIALIETMATNNRLWGAERIRGNCSSSTFAWPSARSSGTCAGSGIHDRLASTGRRFCAIMLTTPGRAISSRPTTCSSDRSSRSSWSNSGRGGSRTSE